MGYVLPHWRSTREGPPLEAVTRRLAECPPEFLAEPACSDGSGEVVVAAVVSDLLCDLGGAPLSRREAQAFHLPRNDKTRNLLRVVLVASWMLHEAGFRGGASRSQDVREFLSEGLRELADLVDAEQFVMDAERREELARLALRGVALRPAGESIEVAQDRFDTISSPLRLRVMREAQAAEKRARKVRDELARKARQEAAATYGSE